MCSRLAKRFRHRLAPRDSGAARHTEAGFVSQGALGREGEARGDSVLLERPVLSRSLEELLPNEVICWGK
jgi:hypothetical protein